MKRFLLSIFIFSGLFLQAQKTKKKTKTKTKTHAQTKTKTKPANTIFDGSIINIETFGAKADGVTDNTHAWELAKAAVPASGGTVIFGKGKYFFSKGLKVYRSNIRIKGAGKEATIILSGSNGLEMAPYRYGGWDLRTENLCPYIDSMAANQSWVSLKVATDADKFHAGQIIFINAGGSYYDQSYGEFNIIDKIAGSRLYLKYNLSRDYSSRKSSWRGELMQDFSPPAAGETAVVVIKNPPPSDVKQFSIGNDMYVIVNGSGNNITVRNPGKGNSSDIIPAGTKVYKLRAVINPASVANNIEVSDLTISGLRKSVVVSNSVKTRFDRVNFLWAPDPLHPGGIWLDGDDGRDFTMVNCEVHCVYPNTSQFARSFIGVNISQCKFFQASIDFSEFNAQCTVDHSEINIEVDNNGKFVPNGVTIGATTSNINIVNNNINITGTEKIKINGIGIQPDIQMFAGISRTAILVKDNIIKLNKGNAWINLDPSEGIITVEGNTLTGSGYSVFGGSSGSLRSTKNSRVYIRNNKFMGTTDGVFTRGNMDNIDVQNNTFQSLGEYQSNGTIIGQGNIIMNGDTRNEVNRLVFKNNTFIGWKYYRNSFNFNRKFNDSVNISNNRFINNKGNFRTDKNFTITITK